MRVEARLWCLVREGCRRWGLDDTGVIQHRFLGALLLLAVAEDHDGHCDCNDCQNCADDATRNCAAVAAAACTSACQIDSAAGAVESNARPFR